MTVSWCVSPYAYTRRPTREVRIGDVGVGGRNPIRVQSMTTPATSHVPATVEQIVRLVEAGCEIVRVTVPTSQDARALPEIRRELADRKIRVPLVADIHFSPGAALKAVEHVEKIRVNPGNYADRKQFAVREYTDAEYESELARLAETFRPLVIRARTLGVAMRIGTNHGSLSDRIMNRYGDSPLGMVESALEFVRICESEGYRDLVISMKASNPVVTIEAYRLLAARMSEERMDYPFHLGVTEAGDGEDGRIKSAIGIGALLDDGIGDTVRVSLTEDPVAEIPVAQRLVEPYNRASAHAPAAAPAISTASDPGTPPLAFDPYSYARRRTRTVTMGPRSIGGEMPVAVEIPLRALPSDGLAIRAEIDAHAGPRVPIETRADLVEVSVETPEDLALVRTLRETMSLVAPALALSARLAPQLVSTLLSAPRVGAPPIAGAVDRVRVDAEALADPQGRSTASTASPWDLPHRLGAATLLEGSPEALCEIFAHHTRPTTGDDDPPLTLAVRPGHKSAGSDFLPQAVRDHRRLVAGLAERGVDLPLVLTWDLDEPGSDPLLAPALALGALLCDGIGDAVSVRGRDSRAARALAFNILQAARVRISKTEFISCPSCGRTLFDLEETTRRIKGRTAHLKGLKIAVMGCVVNGPGEMADADFGYVGWGAGKIALFVGKEIVARDVPTEEADDRLVELIKAHGKWQDPVPAHEPAS